MSEAAALLTLWRSLLSEAELAGGLQVVLTLLLASSPFSWLLALLMDSGPGLAAQCPAADPQSQWPPRDLQTDPNPLLHAHNSVSDLLSLAHSPQFLRVGVSLWLKPLSGFHVPSFPHSCIRSIHIINPILCNTHSSACLTSTIHEYSDGSCDISPDCFPENSWPVIHPPEVYENAHLITFSTVLIFSITFNFMGKSWYLVLVYFSLVTNDIDLFVCVILSVILWYLPFSFLLGTVTMFVKIFEKFEKT